MQNSPFVVKDTPFCVWEWNLHEMNMEFLKCIDPSYFEYVSQTHLRNISTESRQHAAVALRSAYQQGLEALFMLIGAALQAPDCVVGWFQKCQTKQLREIVGLIENGHSQLPNKLGLGELSWSSIACHVLPFSYQDEQQLRRTQDLFAGLWQKFAHDFTDSCNIAEYNSIKHGLRIRAGGFAVKIKPVREDGSPEDEVTLSASSEFGSSFFAGEPISGAPNRKGDPHFSIRRYSLNWDAEAIAHGLSLIALSIKNLVSFLKCFNGADPEPVQFVRPSRDDYFSEPWRRSPKVTNVQMITGVSEEHICRASKKEIVEFLEREGGKETQKGQHTERRFNCLPQD